MRTRRLLEVIDRVVAFRYFGAPAPPCLAFCCRWQSRFSFTVRVTMVVFADFLELVLVSSLPMTAAVARCGLVFSSLIFWLAPLDLREALSSELSLCTFREAAIAGARDCRHLWVIVLAAARPSFFGSVGTRRDLLDAATLDAPLLV